MENKRGIMENKGDELEDELEKYQHKNGLFPASADPKEIIVPMMKEFWIRDNYYIHLAVNQEAKQKMIKSFQNLTDYLKSLGKFAYKQADEWEDWMHIHPRYDKNLKEIPGQWGWVQNDSVGNLLEILSNAKDAQRAKLIADYLNTIEYWICPDCGFWEDPPKKMRSSSLAACIRGLESYQTNIENNAQIKELLNRGYKALYKILPNETKTREHDLTLLSLIYPKQIVDNEMKNKIIKKVQCLEGKWGIKRYFGDKWDGKDWPLGFGNEREWLMGLFWLYLCTGDQIYFHGGEQVAKEFGMIEGSVNGKPTGTLYLLWTKAMYELAKNKLHNNI